MNISLDYDGTYTEDMESWNKFIDDFQSKGHTVYLVTMRYPHEANKAIKDLSKKIQIIFTSRNAKRPFVDALGIKINVWIDDNPLWIYQNSI